MQRKMEEGRINTKRLKGRVEQRVYAERRWDYQACARAPPHTQKNGRMHTAVVPDLDLWPVGHSLYTSHTEMSRATRFF